MSQGEREGGERMRKEPKRRASDEIKKRERN